MGQSLRVLAPLPGETVAMRDVPDPVFAELLVGAGVALDPMKGTAIDAVMGSAGEQGVLAPIAGTVAKVLAHAFVIQSVEHPQKAVMVHLGLDTVKLQGAGFTRHAHDGSLVAAGAPIVTWNPRRIKELGYNTICLVIAMQAAPQDIELRLYPAELTRAQDLLFTWM